MRCASCVEDLDELVADDLSLRLRIAHSRQLLHEALGGIDRNQVQAEIVAQIFLHFLELVFAQHAVVDEHAGEPRFPGPSRMARSTSTAATEESTPPESAQIARPLPTCCFTWATVASIKCWGVQEGFAPQMLSAKLRRMSVPSGVWCTSG